MQSKFTWLAIALTVALGSSTMADDNADKSKIEKRHVAVFINKESDDGDAKVKLKINGESWKFVLPQLSDGEERIIATDDGRTVKAKRKGKDVTVEAGGETINMPADGGGMHVRFHGVPPVPPVPGVAPVPPLPPEEVEALRNSVLISGVDLTEAQQNKIREAFKKAGIDKPVKFVQGGKTMILHSHVPALWHDKVEGDTVRRVIVVGKDGKQEITNEDVMGEDAIQIQHDIEVIRKKTDDDATQ
jgi:hypothetical protein